MKLLVDDTIVVNKLDEILEHVIQLCANTDGTFWHREGWEVFFDSIGLFASVAALIAIATVVIEYRKLRISQSCQSQVLEEIMRYLYVNDTIIEIIRLKMEERGWSNCYPHEAIIRRFKFSDKDLSITNFTITATNYHMMHELQLFLRNYNIMADTAAQHFDNPELDKRIKLHDLADLQDRSYRIYLRINDIRDELKLPVLPMVDIIKKRHRASFDNTNFELTAAENAIVEKINIPPQYEKIAMHYKKAVADRYMKYYDIEILPLTDKIKNFDTFSEELPNIMYDRKFHPVKKK